MSSDGADRVSFYRPVHQGTLIILMTVLIVGALAAVYSVRWIFLGTLVGVGIGTLIAPLAERFKLRFKVPRTVTSLVFLFLLYGAFLTVGYFLFSMISDQIVPAMRKLPSVFHGIQGRLADLTRAHPGLATLGIPQANFDFQKYLNGAAGAIVDGVRVGASALAGVVFIFFVALYLSIRPREYLEGLISAFPSHRRHKMRIVLGDCAQSLRHWFWAQLFAMSVVGICAAIALKIVGSPYWAFFGALTFVLELIPYFGPLTALTSVCLVTAAADPDSLLKTMTAFAVVLALEGNVIIPLIMRGSIKLPPVYLLVLITVMGEWFGIFGFLMAAPTLAVLRTAYLRAYLPLMNASRVHPAIIPRESAPLQRVPRPKRSPTQA
jgi:predicted PurR-regulated permease PerM